MKISRPPPPPNNVVFSNNRSIVIDKTGIIISSRYSMTATFEARMPVIYWADQIFSGSNNSAVNALPAFLPGFIAVANFTVMFEHNFFL